jgi:hypothetical protein
MLVPFWLWLRSFLLYWNDIIGFCFISNLTSLFGVSSLVIDLESSSIGGLIG